jgi:hypothetical protein
LAPKPLKTSLLVYLLKDTTLDSVPSSAARIGANGLPQLVRFLQPLPRIARRGSASTPKG